MMIILKGELTSVFNSIKRAGSSLDKSEGSFGWKRDPLHITNYHGGKSLAQDG